MEDFVDFKLAQKLKEKGFRKPCILYYNSDKVRTWFNEPDIAKNFVPTTLGNDDVLAPAISQVLKWLREEKKLFIEISCNYTDYFPTVRLLDSRQTDYIRGDVIYSTYEQAALAGIEYVLDNLI